MICYYLNVQFQGQRVNLLNKVIKNRKLKQRFPLKGGTQLPNSASSHHRHDDVKSHISIRI